jgi:hypothetical protein
MAAMTLLGDSAFKLHLIMGMMLPRIGGMTVL